MKFNGVIFDLDGTLVNSLEDIANAMNSVLQNGNYPTHSYEKYQNFIGSGLRNLVHKSLPDLHNSESQIERYYQLMLEVYSNNCTNQTRPYYGIIDLLDSLLKLNMKLGVLSNKSDALTKKIVEEIFPHYFSPIVGLSSESLKKPNPFKALEICKSWGFAPDEIILVGDSGIDMKTASNANMYPIGVIWGYRLEEELIGNGANQVLNHPSDLIQILTKSRNTKSGVVRLL